MNADHKTCPYELCLIADLGDTSVNPIDLDETMRQVKNSAPAFMTPVLYP